MSPDSPILRQTSADTFCLTGINKTIKYIRYRLEKVEYDEKKAEFNGEELCKRLGVVLEYYVSVQGPTREARRVLIDIPLQMWHLEIVDRKELEIEPGLEETRA